MQIEVTEYTLNSTQKVLSPHWTFRAAACPSLFDFFGPVVLLTKLPPLRATFPAEVGGAAIQSVITASSCLPPVSSNGKLVKWIRDETLPENGVELPALYKAWLSFKHTDQTLFSTIGAPLASEVIVSSIGESTLPFKAKYLPKIVWPGQVFPVVHEKSADSLYGGLFSHVTHWKVTKVNKSDEQGTGFEVCLSTRMLQAADTFDGVLPKSISNSVKLGCLPYLPHLMAKAKALSRLMKCAVSQIIFISGSAGSGKRALVRLSADRAGRHLVEISGFDLSSLQDLEASFAKAKGSCVIHFRHFIEAWNLLNWGQASDVLLRKFMELIASASFVILSSSEPISALPGQLRNRFNLSFEIEAPDEASRAVVLASMNPELAVYARDTAGRSLEELTSFERKLRAGHPVELLLKRSGSLVPNVKWEDVGGLMHAKQDIMDTVLLPLQQPELFAGLQPRSGLLLYGPPGTGKTLLAKAVATECCLNFVAVKGPELLSMYVGDSEKNIRDLFRRCRNTAPCILFFDELDSLAPARGASADSGKVMERVVAQLLTELDGVRKSTGLFVIAATNRPDLLDPALLRPGRLDKSVFVDVCRDRPSQLKVLQAVTRKFALAPNCNLESIVELLSLRYSGADFYALASEALMQAYKERASELQSLWQPEQGPLTAFMEGRDLNVEVKASHFEHAAKTVSASLSEAELSRYRSLNQTIEGN